MILNRTLALRGLFLTFKRHPLGQITLCSLPALAFDSVMLKTVCELEMMQIHVLIYVIPVSVNSICWVMIRAEQAVFTHSDHSCRSRFWLISATELLADWEEIEFEKVFKRACRESRGMSGGNLLWGFGVWRQVKWEIVGCLWPYGAGPVLAPSTSLGLTTASLSATEGLYQCWDLPGLELSKL